MTNITPDPHLPATEAAAPDAVSKRPALRKRTLIAVGIAAGLVLSGGTVTAAIAVNNHKAETTRLCTDAMMEKSIAFEDKLMKSAEDARAALEAASDTAIQEAVPGAAAFSKVAAIEADEEKKITARASAAELIQAVQDGEKRTVGLVLTLECDTREAAQALQDEAKSFSDDAAKHSAAVAELEAAVTDFKESETARLAAEKEAAKKKAAEAKAAAERAAQAAAEQAAAEQWTAPAEQYPAPGYDAGYNNYNPGSGGDGGGGTSAPPPAPAQPAPSAPAPGGGGTYVPPKQGNGGAGYCDQPGVNCYA